MPFSNSRDDYDEFGLLHENATEWDMPLDPLPLVRRHAFALPSGQELSYLRWGDGDPEVVLLHGGGQNAHTWDTLALALGRPALAIDLPGHGHSGRRADRDYGPWQNADAVAALLGGLAPAAEVVVGMSLGGATTIRLAAAHPDVCARAVIIDVTPQINDPSRSMTTSERGSVALIMGPPTYASLEEMADAAIALTPNRPASAVRRGVRHNAYQLDDGRWTWRYDLFGPSPDTESGEPARNWSDFTPLWDDVSSIGIPAMFVRGGDSRYVLDDDLEEMRRRQPALRVEVVADAGRAVQSDQPLELARLIEDFAFA